MTLRTYALYRESMARWALLFLFIVSIPTGLITFALTKFVAVGEWGVGDLCYDWFCHEAASWVPQHFFQGSFLADYLIWLVSPAPGLTCLFRTSSSYSSLQRVVVVQFLAPVVYDSIIFVLTIFRIYQTCTLQPANFGHAHPLINTSYYIVGRGTAIAKIIFHDCLLYYTVMILYVFSFHWPFKFICNISTIAVASLQYHSSSIYLMTGLHWKIY